ncbi:OB-fold putative lipoprotein [Oxalobacter vibrioformis]|uniref:OB-fold putative lipoprotein n=1 Tax=Oxalobacter vibrioformis TaxID=933080 RepID=A0A9E9M0M1_9BURK|nr:hypothetical protein [Oxalobacter vibrioformis]WAW10987.1 OB-fold putative lipoprotein [Oxalobacter vibrioformis]
MIKKTILLTGMLFVLLSCSSDNVEKKAAAVNKLDELSMRVLEELFMDDLKGALRGIKSAVSKESAQKIFAILGNIPSRQLAKEYDANEVAADELYKNKTFIIDGKIQSIEKDFTGTPVIRLNGSNMFQYVHAHFGKESIGELSKFKKGQNCHFICDVRSYIMGNVTLDNCKSIDSYVNDKKGYIKSAIVSILRGGKSADENFDMAVRVFYRITKHIPENSSCKTQLSLSDCEDELDKLPKDMIAKIVADEKAAFGINE